MKLNNLITILFNFLILRLYLSLFYNGTILNDTIYIKNKLSTYYKNLVISANVNLVSINSKLSMNRRGIGMNQ